MTTRKKALPPGRRVVFIATSPLNLSRSINWLRVIYGVVFVLLFFSCGLGIGLFRQQTGKEIDAAVTLVNAQEGVLESKPSKIENWQHFEFGASKETTLYYPPYWERRSSDPLYPEANYLFYSTHDLRLGTQPVLIITVKQQAPEQVETLTSTTFTNHRFLAAAPKSQENIVRQDYYLIHGEQTYLFQALLSVNDYDYTDVINTVFASLEISGASPLAKSDELGPELYLSVQQRGNGLQFRARVLATGEDVQATHFFIDGGEVGVVSARALSGDTVAVDFQKQSEASKSSRQWLEKQVMEKNFSYNFRHYRNWSGVVDDCLIDLGFIHIFASDNTYYDVRTSSDLTEHEICFEGPGIQVEENWYFLTEKPSSGSHVFTAVAYDLGGDSTTTTINLMVR